MIAAGDLEHAPGIREGALFDVLDPGAIDAELNLVLGFASDRAGMAADALAIVDYEGIFHGERTLRTKRRAPQGSRQEAQLRN
jgi:hypothetical protein